MPSDVQITSDSDLDVVLEEFNKRHKRRDSTGPKYNCSIAGCNESFKRLDQLDRHEFHHTGIKKHACTYEGCEKSYSILTHLKRHVRITHERTEAPQKTIKCILEECNKMFTSPCNMQRHVREAHESPREYVCTFCAMKFRQKMKLRRHEIQQHTKEYPHRCEKCARGFYQQWQKESHQRSCKLYTCHTCQQQFDKWTLYIKHCRETLHNRGNRHQCEQCDKNYEKPSDLAKHIAAKHIAKPIEQSIFKCIEPGCDRSYAYERNLKQHVATVHTGKRFQCLKVGCNRGFSSAQNFSKHVLRDHSEVSKPDQPSESVEIVKKTRKRRRDAGQPARSHLAKLSCLQLDKQVDNEVRQRKPLAMKNLANEIQQEQQLDQLMAIVCDDTPIEMSKD